MKENLSRNNVRFRAQRPINRVRGGKSSLIFFIFLLASCSAGPPQIISLDQGHEINYSTLTNSSSVRYWIYIEYQDGDGIRDLAEVRVELADGRFWYYGQPEPILLKPGQFGVLLRGLILPKTAKNLRADLIINDYNGTSDRRTISISSLDKNPDIPKMLKNDINFTLTGNKKLILSYVNTDGKEIGRREYELGLHQWKDLEPGWIENTAHYYLQYTDPDLKLIVSSGPW